MSLPATIQSAISDPVYARVDQSVALQVLDALGCTGSTTFRELYTKHAGPFGGSGRYELLDVVDGPENIVTQTEMARSEFGFPARYLVISNYVGNAVLVYDCETDAVFDVDFEGSDRALMAGTLEPRWRSFAAFLVDFFSA